MAKKRIKKQRQLGSDHTGVFGKVKRIKGQLKGIEHKIGEKPYCGDVLGQLRAIKSGINSIEASILEAHINSI